MTFQKIFPYFNNKYYLILNQQDLKMVLNKVSLILNLTLRMIVARPKANEDT